MKLEHVMDFKARLYSPVIATGKGRFGTRHIYNLLLNHPVDTTSNTIR